MKSKNQRKKRMKNYNPFKMFGSWIGVGLGIIESIFAPLQRIFNFGLGLFGGFNFGMIFNTLMVVSLGFLIGWGIHSLIRRLRK